MPQSPSQSGVATNTQNEVVSSPMYYAQVNSVAKEGSQIAITLAGGRVIRAPGSVYDKVKANMLTARAARAAQAAGAVAPNDTVDGGCGVSWVYIGYQNTAAKPYLMTTGFTLKNWAAVSVDWVVHITGPGNPAYVYTYKTGASVITTPSKTWRGSHAANGPFGRWAASVDTLSWAIDVSGGVCSSAGPVDSHAL